jgi:hypothetical protein
MLDDGQVRLLKVGSVQRLAGMLFNADQKTINLDDMDVAIAQSAVE